MPIPDLDDNRLLDDVRDDLLACFKDRSGPDEVDRGTSLPPIDEGEGPVTLLEEEFGVMRSDSAATVAWRYTGLNSVRFLSHAPTGRKIEVEGVTVVRTDNDGQLEFARVIDWYSVYAQLGALNGGHPVTASVDEQA